MPFKRTAVTIGSNILARTDGTLDITRMLALVDQVTELHSRGVEIILIPSVRLWEPSSVKVVWDYLP